MPNAESQIDEAALPVTVEAAELALRARLVELEEGFKAAEERLATRELELVAATKEREHLQQCLRAANSVTGALQRRLKREWSESMLACFDSVRADHEHISLEPMANLDRVRAQEKQCLEVISGLVEFYIPEATEIEQVAQRELLLARAASYEALASWRELQREIRLSPAVQFEGAIAIDAAETISGKLRLDASNFRISAQALEETINESQRLRKAWQV